MKQQWIINSRKIEDYLFTTLELDHQIIYLSAHNDFDKHLKTWIHHQFHQELTTINLVKKPL